MKRRYRIKVVPSGYIPQVKWGWLPWFKIGADAFWDEDGAKKVCDMHNRYWRFGVLEGQFDEYTPKPPKK